MDSTVFIVGVGPGLGESLAKIFRDANYKVGLIARSRKNYLLFLRDWDMTMLVTLPVTV